MELETILAILASTLRMATPLVLAAMAGIISERSGVINIALEGFMLVGAFAAAAITALWPMPWLGVVGAIASGLLLSGLYGYFCLSLRTDQIVAGTALNMFAIGVTPLLCKLLFGVQGATPALAVEARFSFEPMLIAALSVLGLSWLLRRTAFGLHVTFAGANPEALACSGVDPLRVRWQAVLLSGMLASMAGASLSIYLASSFARQMSAGRGFMALAALILGRWQPWPAALACLFFGFTEALQIRLQGVTLPGASEPVPVQIIQILPYLLTLVVLLGLAKRSGAPRALGKHFQRL